MSLLCTGEVSAVNGDGTYHYYIPLYPAGELYHPVSLLHGSGPTRLGPWTWNNLTGVDVSFNVDVSVSEVGFVILLAGPCRIRSDSVRSTS